MECLFGYEHAKFISRNAIQPSIKDWNVSAVTNMQSLFGDTPFNQPIGNYARYLQFIEYAGYFRASLFDFSIGDWNISSLINMENMFEEADSLSLANRKKIHATFSANPNWTYDWSTFYRPSPQVLSAQVVADLKYTFNGKILATGGMPVTKVAFELADNMLFRNAQSYPAILVDGNFSISLVLEGGKRYFYRANATNEVGTKSSSAKILETSSTPTYWWSDYPVQEGGWRSLSWFGTFRPYNNGWIYHTNFGWVYAHPDGTGGLWLWMQEQSWLWTKNGAYPYFWKNSDGSWQYLLGSRNGKLFFQEWRSSFSAGKP